MARGAGDYRYFRILTPGRGAGRYMLAGGTASLAELIDLMRRVTGRRLVRATAPAPLVLGMTAAGDVVQRVLPFRLPFNFGGVWVATHEVRSTHRRRSGTSACASDHWRTQSRTCFAGCIGPAT